MKKWTRFEDSSRGYHTRKILLRKTSSFVFCWELLTIYYNMATCNKLPVACPAGRLGTTFHFIIALLLPCEIYRFMVVLRDHLGVEL